MICRLVSVWKFFFRVLKNNVLDFGVISFIWILKFNWNFFGNGGWVVVLYLLLVLFVGLVLIFFNFWKIFLVDWVMILFVLIVSIWYYFSVGRDSFFMLRFFMYLFLWIIFVLFFWAINRIVGWVLLGIVVGVVVLRSYVIVFWNWYCFFYRYVLLLKLFWYLKNMKCYFLKF